MNVKIKLLLDSAKLPKKGTDGAAAYDVYIPQSTFVKKGRQVIPLGFAIELPYGYEAKIEPRSGFSSKGMEDRMLIGTFEDEPTRRFDCDVIQGKIDCDYRGEVGVIVHNRDCEFLIEKHCRIAQFTIYKVEDAEFEITDELTETKRNDGGFGSTNK